jgi:predicted ATPase/DNA-binding winged helix-turn-helix (wHTH) protein
MSAAVYRFGSFELHAAQRRLLASGEPVPVTGRAFDLLVALVAEGGHLVTKEELFRQVWSGLVVEESNLAVQVSALRKIVGASAIQSVSGHGYRFALDVQIVSESSDAPARHDNLPSHLTRFIGRDRDLANCRDLLQRTRLLTITGAAGLGKTRLSLAVAEDCAARYVDGVWLVELAPLADPRMVVQAIASVLGVAESGRPALEAVGSFLRDRRLLLVLDNCEHLIVACAAMAHRMLQDAPHLSIVASSREPLHIAGEIIYELPPLTVPDRRMPVSVDALAAYDAVQLFVERATAVQPGFDLTEANAAAVAKICTELDGIPLALELAAARARIMSVDAIAQRLGDRFRLLKGADRTSLPRQQTLESTIAWSYDLLTPAEQAVLCRLAVFSGGWTLDAAEEVAAGDDVDASQVIDLHSRLVDKSLLTMETQGDRYGMLESIRLYALARLDADGAAAARTRHLMFFVAFVNSQYALPGPDDEARSVLMSREGENLRSAYEFATRSEGLAAAALRLVSPIGWWLCTNYFDLGSPILAGVLARPEVQSRDLVRYQGLGVAAFLSYHKGLYEDARRLAEEALGIAREVGTPQTLADALNILGDGCDGLHDRVAARRYYGEALEVARESGALLPHWAALNGLAEVSSGDGELEAAANLYEQSLLLGRQMGARNLIMVGLLNLARVAVSTGAAGRAELSLREALATFEEMGARQNLHALLSFSAGLAVLQQDWESGARLLGASDGQLQTLGLHRQPADDNALAPLIARAKEKLGAASFEAAYAAGRASTEAEALLDVRAWLKKDT